MLQDPNRLEDSDIRVRTSPNEWQISIPGYKVAFTFSGFIWIGFAVLTLTVVLRGATEIQPIVVCSTLLFVIFFCVVLMHSKTKIYFSKGSIKVKYGWMPFVRRRRIKNLERVYIKNSDSSDMGNTFTYLILTFKKEWNIHIIIDHLSRQERDFLTGRISYLRSKFYEEK